MFDVLTTNSLEDYIISTLKTHGIYGSLKQTDRDDILLMIIDEVCNNSKHTLNKNGYVVLGIDNEELERAIIKAPTLLTKYRKRRK